MDYHTLGHLTFYAAGQDIKEERRSQRVAFNLDILLPG